MRVLEATWPSVVAVREKHIEKGRGYPYMVSPQPQTVALRDKTIVPLLYAYQQRLPLRHQYFKDGALDLRLGGPFFK